jgi:hypothetical protein
VTRTVVPWPNALSMATVPPCASAVDLTIGRPRPVPVFSRVIALSIWPKGASAIGISSAAMPMPVSLTAIDHRRRRHSSASAKLDLAVPWA